MKLSVKKRVAKVVIVTAITSAVIMGYALFVYLTGFGIPCVYKKYFGFDCAGCGLSRAAAALIRLDLETAFSYNAVWPLYLAYAVWAGVYMAIVYIKEERPPELPRPRALNRIAFAVMLCYGAVRNFL